MKNIKLFLLGLLAVILVSCTPSNDSLISPDQPKQYFNPPTWIQGTWKAGSISMIQFTTNDFILVQSQTSYKQVLEQAASNGQTAKTDETISDTTYNVTITTGGSSGTYKFQKVSATQISMVNPYNQNTTLTKQ